MATGSSLSARIPISGLACLTFLVLLVVTVGCGGDEGDGSSGAMTRTVNAAGGANFTDIQSCIFASSNGDTCLVYAGTYGPLNFAGRAVTVQSISGPDYTFIDGGGSVTAVHFENYETSGSVLNGFTVRNGKAVGTATRAAPADPVAAAASDAHGGGIRIFAASPIIANCVVKDNQAAGNGGGIYCALASSRPQLTHVVIGKNTADGQGGGLYVFSSSPEMKNCLVFGNVALSGDGAGAVAAYGADISMVNCTVANNHLAPCLPPQPCDPANAIYLDQASATLRDSILWHEDWNPGDPPPVLLDFPQPPTLDYQTTLSVTYTLLQVHFLAPGLIDLEIKTPSCRFLENSDRCYLVDYDDASLKNADPLFIDLDLQAQSQTLDPRDEYYLTQTTAGPSQTVNSPAVDAGSQTAGLAGLSDRTTRNGETTPQLPDGSTGLEPDIIVDLGYHYPITYP